LQQEQLLEEQHTLRQPQAEAVAKKATNTVTFKESDSEISGEALTFVHQPLETALKSSSGSIKNKPDPEIKQNGPESVAFNESDYEIRSEAFGLTLVHKHPLKTALKSSISSAKNNPNPDTEKDGPEIENGGSAASVTFQESDSEICNHEEATLVHQYLKTALNSSDKKPNSDTDEKNGSEKNDPESENYDGLMLSVLATITSSVNDHPDEENQPLKGVGGRGKLLCTKL
jgi:hypothetical protein